MHATATAVRDAREHCLHRLAGVEADRVDSDPRRACRRERLVRSALDRVSPPSLSTTTRRSPDAPSAALPASDCVVERRLALCLQARHGAQQAGRSSVGATSSRGEVENDIRPRRTAAGA